MSRGGSILVSAEAKTPEPVLRLLAYLIEALDKSRKRNDELEAKIGRNFSNPNKPPSTDSPLVPQGQGQDQRSAWGESGACWAQASDVAPDENFGASPDTLRNLSMKMRHLFFVISVVFPPSQDDLSRPPLAHEEEEVSFL